MTGFLSEPILGIETTGSLSGAALYLHGRLSGETAVDVRAGSAESLLEMVRALLALHSIRARDLRRIGIALGPGSFTGVRVGLAAARALALGAKVPLVGVPSHQALSWSWRDLGRGIVLLTGFRRGQVFFEAGVWEGSAWRILWPAASLPVSEIGAAAASLSGEGQLLFLGEAVESVCEACPELRGLGILLTEPLAWMRRPAAVAALAALPGAEERGGRDLELVAPLYLRGADARRPRTAG